MGLLNWANWFLSEFHCFMSTSKVKTRKSIRKQKKTKVEQSPKAEKTRNFLSIECEHSAGLIVQALMATSFSPTTLVRSILHPQQNPSKTLVPLQGTFTPNSIVSIIFNCEINLFLAILQIPFLESRIASNAAAAAQMCSHGAPLQAL